MRIWIGRAAVLVGAFALVAAAVAVFWGKSAAERLPLSVDARTVLTGTATGVLAENSTEPLPVKSVNVTKADPKASKRHSDDNAIVIVQQGCVVVQQDDPADCPPPVDGVADKRVVSESKSAYALDRHTGLPLKDQAKYVGEKLGREGMKGLVTKFPFDTQKKDYQYWDGTLGTSVTAHYVKDKVINGVKTYQFEVDVPSQDGVELAKDTPGTYAASQTLWIEPLTGAYIDQRVNQTMAVNGSTLLDVHLAYTDATVAGNVDDAHANRLQLNLIKLWVPLGGLIVGVVLLIVGALLILGARKGRGDAALAEPKVPAGV